MTLIKADFNKDTLPIMYNQSTENPNDDPMTNPRDLKTKFPERRMADETLLCIFVSGLSQKEIE